MKRKTKIKCNAQNTAHINDESEDKDSETTHLLQTPKPIFSIVKHYPPSWLQKEMGPAKEEPEVQANMDENGASVVETDKPVEEQEGEQSVSQNVFGFLGGLVPDNNKSKTS